MTSLRSFIKRLIAKNDFITVVSGLPRSGTSMMMSALQAGGMPLLIDHIRKADKNNPKGYFEFEPVKRLPKGDSDWLEDAQGKAVKIISSLLAYLPETFQYRIVFMERNLGEIMASQQHMLARNGKDQTQTISNEQIMDSYQEHLREISNWLQGKDWIDCLFVNYNDVLRQPEGAFGRVSAFLDRRVDPKSMVNVVDVSLYREKNDRGII